MPPSALALALIACAARPATTPASTSEATAPIATEAPAAPAEASTATLTEPRDPNLRTPERSIQTLIRAIEEEDLYTYSRCFTDAALISGEAGVSLLEDPEDGGWQTLQAAFYGQWELQSLSIDGAEASVSIVAPEAEGGGIGAIRLERDEDGWKISDW